MVRKTSKKTDAGAPLEVVELSPSEIPDLSSGQPERAETTNPAEDAESAALGDDDASSAEPNEAEVAATLIGAVEMVVLMSVRIAASRKKLPWNDEIAALATLNAEERATLNTTAPMAVPYFGTALSNSPAVGACIFGACVILTVSGRFSSVRSIAARDAPPGVPSAHAPPQEAGPGSHPSSRTENTNNNLGFATFGESASEAAVHQAMFGAAANAVPVGTVPEEREWPSDEPSQLPGDGPNANHVRTKTGARRKRRVGRRRKRR